MHTKQSLINDLKELGVNPAGTLLVHSSMRSIGQVEGGADTVLDVLCEYMSEGLLVLPAHTWSQINAEYNIYDPATEPSCVGLLTNLFLKREGVKRSLNPTHSVAALGRGAEDYLSGEEEYDTPLHYGGCWWKLYARDAQILFLGCSPKRNTFLHGVEEWNNIPNRLTEDYQQLKIRMPDGTLLDRPVRRHFAPDMDVSENYDKIIPVLQAKGHVKSGRVGDAGCVLIPARAAADITSELLAKNPNLFGDGEPVSTELY
ncbi:MAG: AAC(3) family N-acetyltransferase [Eubacteriales bacterium]